MKPQSPPPAKRLLHQGHTPIFPKHFYQLQSKYSNTWVLGGGGDILIQTTTSCTDSSLFMGLALESFLGVPVKVFSQTDKNKKQNKTNLDVGRTTYLKCRRCLCIDWGPRCNKEKSSRVPGSPFLCFLAPMTGNRCSTMFSCYGSLNVLKPPSETNLFSFMLFLSSVVLIATQN